MISGAIAIGALHPEPAGRTALFGQGRNCVRQARHVGIAPRFAPANQPLDLTWDTGASDYLTIAITVTGPR